MNYIIVWKDKEEVWELNGIQERLIGNHLYEIARENNALHLAANSESHHLWLLRGLGIDIQILEEDGSKVVW